MQLLPLNLNFLSRFFILTQQVFDFKRLPPILKLKFSLILTESTQLLLQQLNLTLKVLDFVHTSKLQVLAELSEVFNSLLVLFSLPDQLCLVLLNSLLVKIYSQLLSSVLCLPHFFSVCIKLVLGWLDHLTLGKVLNGLV